MSRPAVTPAALAQARAALAAAPQHAGLHYNLGVMLDETGDVRGAASCFARAAQLRPDFLQAWNNLGLALESLGRTDEAIDALRRALALRADYPAALKNLARLTAAAGDVETAREAYRRLVDGEPGNWAARLAAGLLLPPVAGSAEEMGAARRRFAGELARLEELAATPPGSVGQRLAALDRHNNFFLAYQGEDDRALQAGYARLVRRLIGDAAPELRAARRRPANGRLRVGFASCFFRDCTVGHYFKSWISGLDPARFEVRVFLLGGPEDAVTEEIRRASAGTLRTGGTLPQAAQAILDAALDVLIYPELGMNGRTHALAALRLAPVQCAGWGHPVTSGHAAMDYFLSCAAMEPEAGDSHYSEALVRLPGLGTRYAMPVAGTARSRGELGLPEAAHLYFFPHAPYKVHPENDALLARILADDPDGMLVLCEGFVPAQSAALRRRLARNGVAAARLVMLPHLPRADFLEAARLCEVMLDTTRWSGGNTSLDALAAGLPIVTRRGHFMRGRQSAGMLELLDLAELVAANDADYAASAVRIGRNRALRDALSQRIAAARGRLFDDPAPVAALASFLLSLPRP